MEPAYADRDERLAELLDRALREHRSGAAPDLDALRREYPDLADEVSALLPVVGRLADATAEGRLLPREVRQGTLWSGVSATADTLAPGGPPAGDPAPAAVGRYEVLASLGQGAMGRVFKARDPRLNCLVALKVPTFTGPPERQAEARRRFVTEAQAASRVRRHPHVCPVYDAGEQDNTPFVVMDFVEGPTLKALLEEQPGGRFADVRRAAELLRQAAEGVAALHEAGIVHRDLKPANLMIDRHSGHVQVTDFGLARLDEGEHTEPGKVLGTPAFMAPEQAAGNQGQVGPASDVYSLGVILFAALTSRLPHQGDNVYEILAWLATCTETPRPSEFRSDLPPDLEAIVVKATQVKPADRYASARELADALQQWLAQGTSPPRRAPRRPWLLPALAGATLLVALLGWGLSQWVAPRPFQSDRDVLTTIHQHLRQTPPERRLQLRYLSLTVLHNRPDVPEAELRQARQALTAGLKALGRDATEALQPIDERQTVFALDLEKVGWKKADWQELLRAYPYDLKYDQHRDAAVPELAKEIAILAPSALPPVRGDWLIVAGSRPSLRERLAAKDSAPEPDEDVKSVVRRYEQDLTLRTAAVELGLSDPEKLRQRILDEEGLQKLGLTPLTEEKTVPRALWSERGERFFTPFQRAASAVEQGVPNRE